MSLDVAIVATGVANLASVAAAFRRLGAAPQVVDDPDAVRGARAVVLPGVGAFGAGATALRQRGLDDALRARIEAGQPTLAICLGMQLLAAASEESPGAPGLGVFAQVLQRFPAGVRTPQFGWNEIRPDPACELLAPGHVYFANSYRLTAAPDGWRAAWAEHGGEFVAALERDRLLACQFHPELSGELGAAILGRWLARC